MEIPGGKTPNTSLSFRYTANSEAIEELYDAVDDEAVAIVEPAGDMSTTTLSENASPKRSDKSSSLLDKYFKSIRSDKDEAKLPEDKPLSKEVTSSPVKEYLNRLGKRSVSESPAEVKEGSNETWKIFHDFKFKIAQAVEDMKTKSVDETRDKSVLRDNSMSDSEENSVTKDLDQQSVGDTDNQVSSLESSMQNLSDMTQPITAKANERDLSLPIDLKNNSESSDDTHKNLVRSESLNGSRDLLSDSLMDVESGVEALEDSCDGFTSNNATETKPGLKRDAESNPILIPPPNIYNFFPNKGNFPQPNKTEAINKNYFCNFTMYFLTIFLVLNYCLFPNCNIWNGFLLGLWCYCFAGNVKEWFLDTYLSDDPSKRSFHHIKKSGSLPVVYTIPSVKEYRPVKKFEGWINHYRFPEYDPFTYHINKTTTAFIKLEGCNLRISYTKTKISKRAFWDEKIENVIFYQHRLYNLTGARVIILPNGLVKRRLWSKKYPLCIILSDKEKIQVLEKENVATDKKESPEKKSKEHLQEESTETNTSPEKKKKFVWRRREKSISHSDGESSKEGLRHRFVRKMHRDKKSDTATVATDPEPDRPEPTDEQPAPDADSDVTSRSGREDDDELDDNEMSRIKELLDEAEMETTDGTVEGEWSVHVKESKDNHQHLYFFARTGRDKHEWYRRFSAAIHEASASAEASAADEQAASEPLETADGIEMAAYKNADKESVSFGKTAKTFDGPPEVTFKKSGPLPTDLESYEKTFWPYLLKILQTHEVAHKQSVETGIMCQIEPTPAKAKKKKKSTKTPSPTCECRLLPPEVTWVNTVLARVIYDVTRDPKMSARVQNRVQRKLNTLKLPSFMSPLLVTELSLCGACPLLERVGGAACDERGVWLDADLRYDGGAIITVLTQINLMKLKEKNMALEDQLSDENVVEVDMNTSSLSGLNDQQLKKRTPAVYDSDVEDSAESSSDDESAPPAACEPAAGALASISALPRGSGSSRAKFQKMVDKIATNKYFQQVTDYKYVKRAMEGLSNTDIKLQLEVHGLEGRLAINFPPPPHDRVWIGFRTNPQLVLKARPAVGARTLRFTQISNWIEQKLSKEFEKVLVLPNMEDFIIDLMTPTPVQFE